MTLREKYYRVTVWYEKVTLMELHHLRMKIQNPKYTISQTALYFGVSMGLVSENLRLASIIHSHPSVILLPSRQDALKWVKENANDGSPKEIHSSEGICRQQGDAVD